jgi:hypothetical protein
MIDFFDTNLIYEENTHTAIQKIMLSDLINYRYGIN